MKIAFLGYGNVGAALADKLALAGHDVALCSSKEASASLTKALARNPALRAVETKAALRAADVVFLATPFQTNHALLEEHGEELNDTHTNPREQDTDRDNFMLAEEAQSWGLIDQVLHKLPATQAQHE